MKLSAPARVQRPKHLCPEPQNTGEQYSALSRTTPSRGQANADHRQQEMFPGDTWVSPQAGTHHALKGILNGTDHQALVRNCFLQVKPWRGIIGDLPVTLCKGHPARLRDTRPRVVREADGRRGGVLQDVHEVPELLTDVQMEPLGCHDSSATARVAVKQGPVVEIKTLPVLRGENGRLSEPGRKQMGWESGAAGVTS